MKVDSSHRSPNVEPQEIPVEFVVLHYTACDLEKTFEIFLRREGKVTSHFVVDTDGTCYDLGNFLEGPIRRAAHAGRSKLEVEGKQYSEFNGFSIGIEIVNFNGNLFPFTDAQYECLQELLIKLQQRFPVLRNPNRIIGHEHIAHWRGKCDPGIQFDWERLFLSLGMETVPLHRFHAFGKEDQAFIEEEKAQRQLPEREFWPMLSGKLEARIGARKQSESTS